MNGYTGWHSSSVEYFVNQQLQSLQDQTFPVFLCPSDPSVFGKNNYRCNMGWTTFIYPVETDEKLFGAFVNSQAVRPGQFQDGLSNTVAFSERVRGDGNSISYAAFQDVYPARGVPTNTHEMVAACRASVSPTPASHFSYSGRTWLVGGYVNTWYNHVYPPNSAYPDCALGEGFVDGGYSIVTARSFHPQHVNAAFADGAARAIHDHIDANVWKHLGTRSGLEIISEEAF